MRLFQRTGKLSARCRIQMVLARHTRSDVRKSSLYHLFTLLYPLPQQVPLSAGTANPASKSGAHRKDTQLIATFTVTSVTTLIWSTLPISSAGRNPKIHRYQIPPDPGGAHRRKRFMFQGGQIEWPITMPVISNHCFPEEMVSPGQFHDNFNRSPMLL
jgi:hypothetical protein